METLRQFRSLGRPAQVLLINQLVNNIGFYMLIPFLAAYMAGTLGFAAWLVGLVLGVRNFSQQGLFLIGGSLADRVGHKPVIVVGCALRAIGFALFGIVESAAGLIFASFLSGIAAALSTPAGRAYLAHAARDRRVEAFAFLTITLTAGSLLGPPIGALLLGYDFRLVCFVAGGMFAVLAVLQLTLLPPIPRVNEPNDRSVLADWRGVLANRGFVLFAVSMVGFFVLGSQIYLAIPLEVRRVTGSEGAFAVLLTISGILSIVTQVRVTTWSQARWRPPDSVAIGVAIVGLAFLPPVLGATAPLLEPADFVTIDRALGGGPMGGQIAASLAHTVNLAPIALTCGLLTLGGMLAQPYVQSMVTSFGGERLVGTYLGMYYLAQGIGAAVGNMATGAALDLADRTGVGMLPWLGMVLIGLTSAWAVVELERRGLLAQPETSGP